MPLGRSRDCLTLSVQIVARPGDDEAALAVAAVLAVSQDGRRKKLRCAIVGSRVQGMPRRGWRGSAGRSWDNPSRASVLPPGLVVTRGS